MNAEEDDDDDDVILPEEASGIRPAYHQPPEISANCRHGLKEKAQLEGEDYIELPAKVVFTIKANWRSTRSAL